MFGVGKKFDKTMSIGYLMYTTILFLVYSIAYGDAVDLSQPITRARFPPSFLFGTASSAYQYEGAIAEGGRKPSNIDTFFQKHQDAIKDHSNANVAVDQYHRYKEDVAIMKDLGFNVYRFSIAWSRVLPYGNLIGGVNQEGINYYNNLINELLENGIQPAVTLFHWDLPKALDDLYLGFLSPKIVDDFRDYADLCFKTFGDRVKHWITLNEPLMISLAFSSGNGAPGRCSNRTKCPAGNSTTEPYIVTHHQILAHAAAVKLYREKYQMTQKGEIGLSLSITWTIPYSNLTQDVTAVSRSTAFQLGWFMNPLFNGSYPAVMIERVGDRLPTFTREQANMVKGSYDFIGINYYSSSYCAAGSCPNITSWSDDRCVNVTRDRNGIPIGQKVGSWINIYPTGLQQLLLHVKNTYNDPIIYITENGVIDPETSSEAVILNDTLRIQYMESHFNTLLEAMGQGVKVKGYMAWSLLDNFEWGDGYTSKFGIVYVDFVNGLKRTPKKSALWFKSLLKPAN